MFSQVEYVSQRWIDAQLEALSDTFLLAANMDPNLGATLESIIDKLNALDVEARNAICKDHIFHTWMTELKSALLDAYDKGSRQLLNSERFTFILNMLNLTGSVAAGTELRFTLRPGFDSGILLPGIGYLIELTVAGQDSDAYECRYVPGIQGLEVGNTLVNFSSFERVESISVVDRSFTFFSDPTGDQYAIAFDDSIDVPQWTETLRGALGIIKVDELSFQLVKNFVSFLVPLRQGGEDRNLSFSVRNLPCVVFKNNEMTPHLIGETLVHEADHQFFYAVEKFDRFWESDIRLQMPTYFSPWRDDPRPLDGILRGLSAFARVSGYYAAVLEAFPFSREEIESVGALLLTRLEESDVAFATLSETGQLTEFGTRYLDDISNTLDQVRTSASKHEQYGRWRDRAVSIVDAHRENWQRLNMREA